MEGVFELWATADRLLGLAITLAGAGGAIVHP
jgi:hypothetical protein